MSKKPSPKSRRRAAPRGRARRRPGLIRSLLLLLGFVLLGALALGAVSLGSYTLYQDAVIRSQFEGKRWALPARVYARPLELFPGRPLEPDELVRELELLGYRSVEAITGPGSFVRGRGHLDVQTRGFTFWDGKEPAREVRISFRQDRVQKLEALAGQADASLLRLEPPEIAGIYPSHNEDRILVKREDLPPVLVDGLVAVEDRSFYSHFGIDARGITRALLANLRAGRTVQGGSTLTQQLVKNFFLSNERTLTRKLNEALMALLVEWHYDKDEILEAYSNEVYLGQDGNRAIHGFGLASRFFFGRPLAELDLHHVALLVGIIRGPSYYDPRRHPERALDRRALVLDVMQAQGLIGADDAATAKAKPLDVVDGSGSSITRYPAFLDLVRRQLRDDYREEDLTSEGLRIFTTLDPNVQWETEEAVSGKLPELEKQGRQKAGELQAAVVVVDSQNGEVMAVVGGREVRLAGFNRALDARRPAGSLLKPAVFLTALEYPNLYTLSTLLDDERPLEYRDSSGTWSPSNYDKRYHGWVSLEDALVHSYNVPTARIGLDLDVNRVVQTLQRLGIEQDLKPFPSLLLGAVDLSPLDVAQLYQTFASGGFRTPLRSIREVISADGEPLQRYPLQVVKAIEPGPAYLITHAMQNVVRRGTAASASRAIPASMGIAGKTGTTDDLRDSWFAGFSGNRLTVAWVGRDDNAPAGLSGSKGALQLWVEVMDRLDLQPLDLAPPPGIETVLIDTRTGLRAEEGCPEARSVPFIQGSAPRYYAPCGGDVLAESEPQPQPEPGSGPQTTEPRARGPISDFFRRLMNDENAPR